MALSMTDFTAVTGGAYAEPTDTFVMSLTAGWDEIPLDKGGRSICAGDLVALAVAVSPEQPIACPPGWSANGSVFWKTFAPGDPDPVFRTERPVLWYVQGYAVTGWEPFDPSASGSWVTTPTDERGEDD